MTPCSSVTPSSVTSRPPRCCTTWALSERDLAESDPLHHRISAAAQSRLLDCAAEATEDTAFGLHLAEQTDPRYAGTIFYAMSASENIGEALTLPDG